MTRHAKVYLSYFGYAEGDFIPCENCGAESVDVHHLTPRSKFGKKRKDEQDKIENLMALDRICHDKARNREFNEKLRERHLENVKQKRNESTCIIRR